MKKDGKVLLILAGLFLGLALLAACAQPGPAPAPAPAPAPKPSPVPAPAPAPTPKPSPTAAPAIQADGKNLYALKCAVCHGPSGEGTGVGPAVAGHSISATKTQVRNPVGTMMAFPTSQLTDRELSEIAEFIASLSKTTAPAKEWEKQTTETIHYWMALVSIKGGDAGDARHHLQDALAIIKEPARKAEVDKVLALIVKGDLHEAEHECEELAGNESPSGVTIQRFHLVLAQRSVEAKNAADVKHHLGHFMVRATAPEKKIAQESLDLAAKGDFHEAEHEIEELLNR